MLILPLTPSWSQQADSLLLQNDPELAELDSLLNSPDSLSILGLLDSLLLMEPIRSQFAVRLGYNSNVNTSSRTLSINKYGLSPGISYYHKSGAYADLATYWSQEYEPSIYLTVPSVGYLTAASKKWSILAEYSRYIYSYTDTSPVVFFDRATGTSTTYVPNTPYTNNLQVSNYLITGKLMARLDYSLLFGKQTVHRLSPSIGLSLTKKKWLGLDRVSIFPSANLIFGSDILPAKTVTTYEPITTRPLEIIYRYRHNLPLFTQKDTYIDQKTVWGISNYAFNFPLSLSLKNWALLVSYTYNLPQALPDEDLDLDNSGYLSVSLTRYLEF